MKYLFCGSQGAWLVPQYLPTDAGGGGGMLCVPDDSFVCVTNVASVSGWCSLCVAQSNGLVSVRRDPAGHCVLTTAE